MREASRSRAARISEVGKPQEHACASVHEQGCGRVGESSGQRARAADIVTKVVRKRGVTAVRHRSISSHASTDAPTLRRSLYCADGSHRHDYVRQTKRLPNRRRPNCPRTPEKFCMPLHCVNSCEINSPNSLTFFSKRVCLFPAFVNRYNSNARPTATPSVLRARQAMG